MTIFLVIGAALSLGGVLVWIAMLLWAAREDGRDQRARNRSSKDGQ